MGRKLNFIYNGSKLISLLSPLLFCYSTVSYSVTPTQQNTTHTYKARAKTRHPAIKKSDVIVNNNQTTYYQASPPQTPKLDEIKATLTNRNPKVIGYLQVDYAHYLSSHTRLGDGEIIRRAFLGVVGTVTPDWGYTLVNDFARNSIRIKDAWLIYTGFKPTTIRIGNMKEPLSIEHIETDLNLTFLERALPVTAFFPDRRIGVNVDNYGQLSQYNSYTVGAGIFGVEPRVRAGEYDDAWSLDGRFTTAFQPRCDQLLHIGVFGTARRPDSNKQVNFNNKPESDVTNVTFVNTGIIMNVNNYQTYGVELAGVTGPLTFQGEYLGTQVTRQNSYLNGALVHNPNLEFKGWYGYASAFLTGDYKPYDKEKGILGTVKPIHSYGAVELAIRYSDVNLTSHPIVGGQEHNVAFGLNWYVNTYVRFMADYIRVYANQAGVHNDPGIYTIRGQIGFL